MPFLNNNTSSRLICINFLWIIIWHIKVKRAIKPIALNKIRARSDYMAIDFYNG